MTYVEPPAPTRGPTAAEVSASARANSEDEIQSQPMRYWKRLSIPYVLSWATAYPVVLKQILQVLLLITYPAWIFWTAVCALTYFVFWVLFWPIRANQKKNHPEEYEASRRIKLV